MASAGAAARPNISAPETMDSSDDVYDLLVIGGGTAGLVCAAGAASLGARTALVERDRLGGECLWTGCVPSKALVSSGRLASEMQRASDFGLPAAGDPVDPARDGGTVLDSVRTARGRIQPHDDPDRFREMGVDVWEGEPARFLSDHEVVVGDRRLGGRKIVIATGSRPRIPPVPGLEEAGFFTHETAFDRDSIPGSVVILGAGAVGVEFAQAYSRLGVEVTLVEMAPRVLPAEDEEVSAAVESILEDEGVRVLTSARAVEARAAGEGRRELVVTDGRDEQSEPAPDDERRPVAADEIFVAAGRRPNLDGLGLDRIGVEAGEEGIIVDDRLRTTRSHIYAAGDVVGGYQFTHVADHEARTVVRNALFPFSSKVDYSVIPWAVFSDPEVARVGLTESEAREEHGDDVGVYRYDVSHLDRAITERSARGMVKLIGDGGGRLLGGHVVAPSAGTMIVELALAMREGTTIGELSDLVHPYPTMSEGIRRAANEYSRSRLTPTVRSWLDRWFRLARKLGL